MFPSENTKNLRDKIRRDVDDQIREHGKYLYFIVIINTFS